MLFQVATGAPDGHQKLADKNEQVKNLLFQAVLLYVEDNEDAKQELLGLLAGSESVPAAS